MLRRMRSIKAGIAPKLLAKNMITVASAFVWYFLAYYLITSSEEPLGIAATDPEHLLIVGSGTIGIGVLALFGSLVINRLWKRDRFLMYWMLAGVFLSFVPLFLPPSSASNLIAISIIFGSYFGLGMPSTMGFFASSTNSENRGRTGGITFLAIGLSFFVLGSVGVWGSVIASSIVLAAIRLIGLISFSILGSKEEPSLELGKSTTYKEIVRNRSFSLYFVPWIMFNLVDYLTIPVINNLTALQNMDAFRNISFLENILIATFAIMAGFLIDMKGRKRLAIFGFAFLGIGYATLGFFPDISGLIFFTIADGIAWGSFNVVFLFTLWGDIAQGRGSEKFYVVGALPYLFANLMYILTTPIMAVIDTAQVFTFASFFLFLSVLPLVFAPETLPEKAMKQRDLKIYIEKAQEMAQKYY